MSTPASTWCWPRRVARWSCHRRRAADVARNELLLFIAAAALVLVLTPEPNKVYCVSRGLTQGPRAGLVRWPAWCWAFWLYPVCRRAGPDGAAAGGADGVDVIGIAGARCTCCGWRGRPCGPAARRRFRRAKAAARRAQKAVRHGLHDQRAVDEVAMFYLAFMTASRCKACCWAQSSQRVAPSTRCWCCLPAACQAS